MTQQLTLKLAQITFTIKLKGPALIIDNFMLHTHFYYAIFSFKHFLNWLSSGSAYLNDILKNSVSSSLSSAERLTEIRFISFNRL